MNTWSRRLGRSVVVGLLAAAVAPLDARQAAAPADPLAPLAFLVGRWEGTSEGEPGKGTVQREYTRVLGARYLHVENRSVYPVQEKNPKGETHEDEGFFSFDKSRQRLVFRQFHIEGFVTQYTMDAPASPDVVVFTSEAIENIPAGYRARESYRKTGEDEFVETFELAEPGKEFAVYSQSRLRRVR